MDFRQKAHPVQEFQLRGVSFVGFAVINRSAGQIHIISSELIVCIHSMYIIHMPDAYPPKMRKSCVDLAAGFFCAYGV
jgi:hypothetical protein